MSLIEVGGHLKEMNEANSSSFSLPPPSPSLPLSPLSPSSFHFSPTSFVFIPLGLPVTVAILLANERLIVLSWAYPVSEGALDVHFNEVSNKLPILTSKHSKNFDPGYHLVGGVKRDNR